MKTKFKPVAACLDEAQMQKIRDRYAKARSEFWDQIEEIEFIHTNNEFEQFLRMRRKDGRAQLYRAALTIGPDDAAALADREILGSTSFHAD